MVVLTYKGKTPPASVLKRTWPIQLEAGIFADSLHWEICLFLNREEADGSCRVTLENHDRKRGKTDFSETKTHPWTSGVSFGYRTHM